MPVKNDDDVAMTLSEDDIEKLLGELDTGPAPKRASILADIIRRWTPDPLKPFENMCVPPEMVEKLQPLFDEYGLTLTRASVIDPFNLKISRSYTAARGTNIEIALVHLRNSVIDSSNGVPGLIHVTTKIHDRPGRVLSEGVDSAAYGYEEKLQSVSDHQTNNWAFIPWNRVRQALDGQIKLETALRFPPTPSASVNSQPSIGFATPALKVDHPDLKTVVDVFVEFAKDDPGFLAGLVLQADWPSDLVTQANARLKAYPDALNQAWSLVKLLLLWNRFDPGHARYGDTYLGRMLFDLLDSVGARKARLADVIVKYHLIGAGDFAKAQSIVSRGH